MASFVPTSAETLDIELITGERFVGSVSSPGPMELVVQTATGPGRRIAALESCGICRESPSAHHLRRD